MTTAVLSEKQFKTLQQEAVMWAFSTKRNTTFHIERLERDGRKKNRLVRELLGSGWIEEHDGGHKLVRQPIIDTIEGEFVDLIPQWDELRKNASIGRKDDDFIRLNCFSTGQLKTLLNAEPGDVQFYVMSSMPFEYSAQFQDEEGDPKTENACPWWGPFDSLDEAQVCLQRAYTEFMQSARRMQSFEVTVTSTELIQHVEETVFNERIDDLFTKNLLWGLIQCELATEDELYHPLKENEDRRRPKISTSLDDGIILGVRGSNVGDDPTNWPVNLGNSIERHQKQIEESQSAVELLTNLQNRIGDYGWSKFKTDYRAKLIEAVQKADAAGEQNE